MPQKGVPTIILSPQEHHETPARRTWHHKHGRMRAKLLHHLTCAVPDQPSIFRSWSQQLKLPALHMQEGQPGIVIGSLIGTRYLCHRRNFLWRSLRIILWASIRSRHVRLVQRWRLVPLIWPVKDLAITPSPINHWLQCVTAHINEI